MRGIYGADGGTLQYRAGPDETWARLPDSWRNISKTICFCQQNGTVFVKDHIKRIVSGRFEGDNNELSPEQSVLVERALKIAHLPEAIWDRVVTAQNVSGGEKQRIAIARNVYRILNDNKRIVIIDEMDANIDGDTAIAIFMEILELCRDRLVLIVAHSPDIRTLPQINGRLMVQNGMLTMLH
jgi:ABC-type transport system involved in cytochrome bd biosynthesis fused ATPase/permease subunit